MGDLRIIGWLIFAFFAFMGGATMSTKGSELTPAQFQGFVCMTIPVLLLASAFITFLLLRVDAQQETILKKLKRLP